MKQGIAKAVMFAFAIIAIATTLFLWKKQDREDALRALTVEYGAQISEFNGEIHINLTNDKVRNLNRFAELIERAEFTEEGFPIQPWVLDLTGNPNLKSLEGANRLHQLRTIMAVDCPQLKTANGIAGLPNLVQVSLTENPSLTDVSAIRDLPSLVTIDLTSCANLKSLDIRSIPNLKHLYLSGCRSLESLDLKPFPRLEQLFIDSCLKVPRLENLETLTSLTDLDVSNCHALMSLEGIDNLKSLIVFDIRNVELPDFAVIGNLPNLEKLRLGGQGNIKNLEAFSQLPKLNEIYIESCPNLESVVGMPSEIEYAGFIRCRKLTNLEGIGTATKMRQLECTGCENLEDISALEALPELKQLSLVGCRKVTDVQQLSANTKLEIVVLGGSGVPPASIDSLREIFPIEKTIFDFSIPE